MQSEEGRIYMIVACFKAIEKQIAMFLDSASYFPKTMRTNRMFIGSVQSTSEMMARFKVIRGMNLDRRQE